MPNIPLVIKLFSHFANFQIILISATNSVCLFDLKTHLFILSE